MARAHYPGTPPTPMGAPDLSSPARAHPGKDNPMPAITKLANGQWTAVVRQPSGIRTTKNFNTRQEAELWTRQVSEPAAHPGSPEIRQVAARVREDIAETERSARELNVDLGEWTDVRKDDLLALLAHAEIS